MGVQDYYIGFDIGGTKCSVVIGDAFGTLLGKRMFATKDFAGPEAVMEKCIDCAALLSREHKVIGTNMRKVGVSIGGPLDSRRGIILSPPNLPKWDAFPLKDFVETRMGIPVAVENDANACAVAEWRFGAGQGKRNIVFLTFGTGMGAGLILDGRLYRGTNDLAGEVGHVRLENTGPCGYGKRGSFEGFCSGGGIADMARFMQKDGHSTLPESAVDAKQIFQLAEEGNRDALEIVGRCAEQLGNGIALLIDILNPECVIIGSIFARSGSLLRDRMQAAIDKEALPLSASVCQVLPAALGERLGDMASLAVAMSE